MPALVPPREPGDPRFLRLGSRFALSALVTLGLVVLLGIAGWKGLTALAFVVALVLAVVSGVLFAIAAFLTPRR